MLKINTIVVLFFAVVFLISIQKNQNKAYQFTTLNSFPPMPVSAINPVTVEGALLGRYLFYDSILSDNYKMSCASCHQQKYAFSDSPNKFSKGNNEKLMLRNTLPLFNLAWYQRFFWDGKASTIEQQIYFPVSAHDEMNLNWKIAANRITNNKFYRNQFSKIYPDTKIDSLLIAKTIAQFLRTLISIESKYDKVIKQETTYTTEEYYGFELVNDQTKGDCLHCHTTDGNGLGTTGGFSNNGLDTFSDTKNVMDKGYENTSGKKSDIGKFKIPSFRNLVFTAPYMHDGRFQTLQQVLDFYSEGVKYSATIDSKMEFVHKGGARLNQKEKHAIIAFLKTMSDSNFVQNKEYSNPFINQK